MTMMSAVVFVTVAIVVVALVATWIGKRRQQSVLAADIGRLLGAAAAHVVTTPTGSQLQERLPPPVARYLRLALPSPKHIEQQIRARQSPTRPSSNSACHGTSIVRCAASVNAIDGDIVWNVVQLRL